MYSDKQILSATYFKRNNVDQHYCERRIVHGNKVHSCVLCDREIPAYSRSLFMKEVFRGFGWFRCWICLDCCTAWIKATRQFESEVNN